MKKILLPILLIVIVVSCKKDQVEPQPEPNPPVVYHSITAGVSDSTYTTVSYSNPSPFAITWDSLNLYGVGNDSLDLDQDGIFDLFFVLNVINPDSVHLLVGIPNPLPSLIVKRGINVIETTFITETVFVGMGGSYTYTYADKLNYGAVISESDDWAPIGSFGRTMRTDSPGMGGPTGGPWGGQIGYLAVRYNDKYGWVHVDVSDNDNPLILGYAIEN